MTDKMRAIAEADRLTSLAGSIHALGYDCENTDGWQNAAKDCFAAAKDLNAYALSLAALEAERAAGEARVVELRAALK